MKICILFAWPFWYILYIILIIGWKTRTTNDIDIIKAAGARTLTIQHGHTRFGDFLPTCRINIPKVWVLLRRLDTFALQKYLVFGIWILANYLFIHGDHYKVSNGLLVCLQNKSIMIRNYSYSYYHKKCFYFRTRTTKKEKTRWI